MVIVPICIKFYLVDVWKRLSGRFKYKRAGVEGGYRAYLAIGWLLPRIESCFKRLACYIKIIIHAEKNFLLRPCWNNILKIKAVLNCLHKVYIFFPLMWVFKHPHFFGSFLIVPHNVYVVIHVAVWFSISFQIAVDHLCAIKPDICRGQDAEPGLDKKILLWNWMCGTILLEQRRCICLYGT